MNWPVLTDCTGQVKGWVMISTKTFAAEGVFQCRPSRHVDVRSNMAGFLSTFQLDSSKESISKPTELFVRTLSLIRGAVRT